MTVLILGGADDEHATHVLSALRNGGTAAELLDSRDFPQQLTIALDPARGAGLLQLPGGRRLDLHEVRSVYWRSYYGVQAPELPHAGQSFLAANDSRCLFESLLRLWPTRWVNGWEAYRLHQTKPVQFALAAAQGIPVPATLLTNDAEAVREFAARYPRCIFKPVQGGAHARRVTETHLTDANLLNLQYAPITLQEEIAGTNIRVFVAGERVMACEVRTRELDYRDDDDPQILTHDLPDDTSALCLRIARVLQLAWTGIDLRRTPDGRYIFLEANPSPMFLGFEQRTNLPLTESLLALLA